LSRHSGAQPAPASSLVIPNQVPALRRMSEWLDATLRQLGTPEQLLFRFDLCANEAVSNIIAYAFPENGAREIALRLYRENGALCLEIEDDGVAFNPVERPRHVQPGSLADAKPGGLGVDLIKSFMDECHYSRQGGRNILRMVVRGGR
jgi:anti-sigma regulatory factor (Ser/Thr protein kinase)